MPKKKRHPNEKQRERLLEVMAENNLDQAILGSRIYRGQAAVSKYINLLVALPPDAAETIGREFHVRPAWLMGLDDWKTWEDVPPNEKQEEIDSTWDSIESAEKLLSALGYEFSWTGKAKTIRGTIPDPEEAGASIPYEDYDNNDPRAYRIVKHGKLTGYCSIREKSKLLDSITDYASYQADKLIKDSRERSKNNG